jgi:hypothetical protein
MEPKTSKNNTAVSSEKLLGRLTGGKICHVIITPLRVRIKL